MSTDLAQSTGITNPLVLVQAMIERGGDANQLEKLMGLAERWQANQAADTFAKAITGFQSEMPIVKKNRQAGRGDGGLNYTFASLDDVMRIARPLLAKWQIVITFTTDPAEAGMRITCRVRVGTHSEETSLTMPIPQMKVNDTQRFGAAVSYLKRYALCAALNIIVSDEDDDAAAQFDLIDEKLAKELDDLIRERGVNKERFLKYAEVAALSDITRANLPRLMDALNRHHPKPARKGGAA